MGRHLIDRELHSVFFVEKVGNFLARREMLRALRLRIHRPFEERTHMTYFQETSRIFQIRLNSLQRKLNKRD